MISGKGHRVGTIGAVALMAMAAVGCSAGGPEYAVPETVCGVPLQGGVVSPLLPGDKEVTEQGEALPAKYDVCRLVVENKTALKVTFSPEKEFYHPVDEYADLRHPGWKAIHDLPFEGKGAVGDYNVMIIAECGAKGFPYLIAEVSVPENVSGDVVQRRADVQEFTEKYVSGAKEKLGCGG